jgi:hypothetical protein
MGENEARNKKKRYDIGGVKMKKLVALLAVAAVMTLGIGNAMAYTHFNPAIGPCTDEDFQRMSDEGRTVAHAAGWNSPVLGPTPAEMEADYSNGSVGRRMISFNPQLGPYSDQDWNALRTNQGAAY